MAPGLTPETFLVRGGFPELHANPRLDGRDFYRSYAATYLERDLRQFLRVSGLRDHARFLRAVALRTSQLLNRADLARDVGISGSTASSWLSVLEATHQALLLEPWFSNRTRSLVKRPKIFLRDSGLAAFLCGVHTVEDLHATPLAGPLWETLVCAELRRAQANERGSWDLAFYRDRSCEADFLLHRGGRFHLGDAKWAERPDPAAPASSGRWRAGSARRGFSVGPSSVGRRRRSPSRAASGRSRCGICRNARSGIERGDCGGERPMRRRAAPQRVRGGGFFVGGRLGRSSIRLASA